MYRKGGRYGPYWFAYDDVTKESPWRPIEGAFTRFGDVLPLLRNPDDMYVIMGPGDETTVEFDASSASALPPGWKRDFLLYTDGWIKDSDLNTAFGTTVGPLPFHGAKSYPYGPADAYPTDSHAPALPPRVQHARREGERIAAVSPALRSTLIDTHVVVGICRGIVLTIVPGQLPPTATFSSMKKGWSKTHVAPEQADAAVLRCSAVLLLIDEPADLAWRPLDREDVVVVRERLGGTS